MPLRYLSYSHILKRLNENKLIGHPVFNSGRIWLPGNIIFVNYIIADMADSN